MQSVGSKNSTGKFISIIESQKQPTHESETHIVNTIMNESGDIKSSHSDAYSSSKFDSMNYEIRQIKQSLEQSFSDISTMQDSIEDLYRHAESFRGVNDEITDLKGALNHLKNSVDQKISEFKLEGSDIRRADAQKIDKKHEDIILQINEVHDAMRNQIIKNHQNNKTLRENMMSPEKQFAMMFEKDPVKDLERRVYMDMDNFKEQVRNFVENRVGNGIPNTAHLQGQILEDIKMCVLNDLEQPLIQMIQQEIRKELCRLTIERDQTDDGEGDYQPNDETITIRNSQVARDTIEEPRDRKYSGIYNKVIVEESKENEDDSANPRSHRDDEPIDECDDERENYDDFDNDESDIHDDMAHLSPPNKLPDSFVESRGSILPSEASSHKDDTINIFDDSDNKFPDVNRSFNYHNRSEQSSLKKATFARNVSQKYLNSQEKIRLNESNILRERLTDPNNVSYNRSNESITISHKTFNHSNIDSEKIVVTNLKNGAGILVKSTIDMEKKIYGNKVNNENCPRALPDNSQLLGSLGSPISIFNPDKKVYTPKLYKNENMTLEELISKIDSRREVLKRSVREDDDLLGKKQQTPEFTESNTSQIYHQSTNDQVSMKTWSEYPQHHVDTKGK